MRIPKARHVLPAVVALVGLALFVIGITGFLRASDSSYTGRVTPPNSTVTTPTTPATTAATSTTVVGAPHTPPDPVSVSIPDLGIQSVLIPLGLNPDNTLEVPTDFSVAGWYTGRPVPGEIGPSIIAGHMDSKTGPAVFFRLRDARPGQKVDVVRADGTTARFDVVAIEQHSKDDFPTARVYGPTSGAELRLITCGGAFDRSTGHYTDNVIVFAMLAEIV